MKKKPWLKITASEREMRLIKREAKARGKSVQDFVMFSLIERIMGERERRKQNARKITIWHIAKRLSPKLIAIASTINEINGGPIEKAR